MLPLFEQYRPKRIEDVVGQDEAVKTLQFIAKRGFVGRVFWITGKSGTGKTTLARIMSDQFRNVTLVAFPRDRWASYV